MSSLDRANDSICLVPANVDAFVGIVENTISGMRMVDGRKPTRQVILTKNVAQITKQQGRAVGHDLSPSVLRNEYKFPGGLACFKELVNLRHFAQRIFPDFKLELAFANQLE